MIGTNEPTIPPICNCPINDFTIDVDGGKYSYVNHLTCEAVGHMNFNVDGVLSEDDTKPGDIKEHAKYSPLSYKPNMVFHVVRDETGELEVVYTYACITKGVFSFNVLAKKNDYTVEQVDFLVQEADALTNGILWLDKIKISVKQDYDECDSV
jgi:hypothetical protein